MKKSNWTSFDVANLIASLITPILVLILGIVINNSIINSERSSELKSAIYKSISSDLNDIYTNLTFIGNWKENTPLKIIRNKRAVDKAMYSYKPFFSDELFSTYKIFMNEAFEHSRLNGKDDRIRSEIRSDYGDRTIHSKEWKTEWTEHFTNKSNTENQREAYFNLLNQLARDLNLHG